MNRDFEKMFGHALQLSSVPMVTVIVIPAIVRVKLWSFVVELYVHRPLYSVFVIAKVMPKVFCEHLSTASVSKVIFAHLCFPKGVIILAHETDLSISVRPGSSPCF